ncbi:MAG: hypothetical protein JSU63_03415 [Phycisphaerales bacterium]|nr:MAG: hypothetical protein JSU63_03415 [Phycisphaerales bacterium]
MSKPSSVLMTVSLALFVSLLSVLAFAKPSGACCNQETYECYELTAPLTCSNCVWTTCVPNVGCGVGYDDCWIDGECHWIEYPCCEALGGSVGCFEMQSSAPEEGDTEEQQDTTTVTVEQPEPAAEEVSVASSIWLLAAAPLLLLPAVPVVLRRRKR